MTLKALMEQLEEIKGVVGEYADVAIGFDYDGQPTESGATSVIYNNSTKQIVIADKFYK